MVTVTEVKIVHEADGYKVREISRAACAACVKGWVDGTIGRPCDTGVLCEHGPGVWQVGTVGPRGGWAGIGPIYTSFNAAVCLADALSEAAYIQRREERR